MFSRVEQVVVACEKELAGRPVEIIRVGVTLSELGEPGVRQLDMFLADDDQRQQAEVLTNTVDRLNAKFGKRVVTFGHWSPPPGDMRAARLLSTESQARRISGELATRYVVKGFR